MDEVEFRAAVRLYPGIAITMLRGRPVPVNWVAQVTRGSYVWKAGGLTADEATAALRSLLAANPPDGPLDVPLDEAGI